MKGMKKDIVAAIVFLVTGILFYLVRTEAGPREALASTVECEAVEESVPAAAKTGPGVELQDTRDGSRDS